MLFDEYQLLLHRLADGNGVAVGAPVSTVAGISGVLELAGRDKVRLIFAYDASFQNPGSFAMTLMVTGYEPFMGADDAIAGYIERPISGPAGLAVVELGGVGGVKLSADTSDAYGFTSDLTLVQAFDTPVGNQTGFSVYSQIAVDGTVGHVQITPAQGVTHIRVQFDDTANPDCELAVFAR